MVTIYQMKNIHVIILSAATITLGAVLVDQWPKLVITGCTLISLGTLGIMLGPMIINLDSK
jgi:hypothetical protein